MGKANILVVDDEPVVLEGVRRILEGDRYSVETCANGRAALDLIQKQDFNMVITDLKMPEMKGQELLKSIKILQPEIPVIIITGNIKVGNAIDTMKNRAIDYILKPFSPDQLREKVARVFKEKSLLLDENYLEEPISK